ncbi:ABC transporter permease [Dehalococcoidia bacterium]|nr:ABC transporter permease [Dehalococcoidia bacterium]
MTKGFLKLMFVEFKLTLREPMALIGTFFFPLLFLFLVMEVFIPEDVPPEIFVNLVLPQFIVIITATTAIFGVPITIVSYRRIKFMKRLKTTPVTPFPMLGAWGIANFALILLGMLPLIAVAKLLYGAEFGGEFLTFSAGFVLTILSLVFFFLIIAAVARTERAATGIAQITFSSVLFLSGAFVPLDMLPVWIARYISPLIPATYAVELLRGLWLGEPLLDLSKEVIVLSGFLIFGAIIATRTFRWE